MAASHHQAHPAFRVDVEGRLLVVPDAVLLGALEGAAALLVALAPQDRPAAEAVADHRRVDEIGDAALPGDLADVFRGDEPGAGNVLAAAAPLHRAEQLLLDDVAGGLVLLAGRPPFVRALDPVAGPPRWIAASE